jgi:non-heme chloroperoxidase
MDRTAGEPVARRELIHGININFLEWGDDAKPPLLLLHGGGQSAYTWHRVATNFAPQYHVVAPDARGHGDSDWSPDGLYGGDRFREDVRELVRILGFDKFVLIGMSMGGMTSLSYAGTYGDTLRGLVLVDIAPDVNVTGRDRIMGFLLGRESFESLDDAVEYAHAFNPRRSREALAQTLPQNLRERPDGTLAWKWDPACFNFNRSEQPTRFGGDDLWQAAARIPCPSLVVHGKQSDILTRDNGERLAAAIPAGAYIAVDGSGHSVQGDNPNSLSDVLATFLDSIGY